MWVLRIEMCFFLLPKTFSLKRQIALYSPSPRQWQWQWWRRVLESGRGADLKVTGAGYEDASLCWRSSNEHLLRWWFFLLKVSQLFFLFISECLKALKTKKFRCFTLLEILKWTFAMVRIFCWSFPSFSINFWMFKSIKNKKV